VIVSGVVVREADGDAVEEPALSVGEVLRGLNHDELEEVVEAPWFTPPVRLSRRMR
jgi:hypothetical protein